MKFKVNENCIGCGLCANTCPDVFSMTEEGIAVAVEGDVATSVEDSAQEALTSCPAGAIEEI
ncbi:MAG: ferredoxin [Megasphaera sp.]|jgi:ferredoxin|uniref:ferredoxin n=1 Tax=Megasphaera sueciensis TaxID=349094 RepID=UPI003D05F594|nr:ferredoxin [Megasphaera sp.]MCI1823235.1 ferredoxin [Megasphaera sp.]